MLRLTIVQMQIVAGCRGLSRDNDDVDVLESRWARLGQRPRRQLCYSGPLLPRRSLLAS